MRCPFCHLDNDRVVDTRSCTEGLNVRRRRLCRACGKKFTTFERIEATHIRVIKRDGTRVPFNREKLQQGIERACWKREISIDQISTLVAQVELDINSAFDTEVQCQFIGERVMHYLSELDQVAYVRFASVYRHFKDADDFVSELQRMKHEMDIPTYSSEYLPKKKTTRFPKKKRLRFDEEKNDTYDTDDGDMF